VASNFRKFLEGLRIVPKTTSSSSETGDLEVLSSDGKLRLYNAAQTGIENSPVVTEAHSATLTNKTLTSPVLTTPTANTITGIAGGALTVQSASNQNLSLQAQGTGVVQLESLSIDANTVTGGVAPLVIQSASGQTVSVQSQGNSNVTLSAGTGKINLDSASALNIQTDSTTTGANATVSSVTKSYVELTNASLTSVDMITAGSAGQLLVLSNRTGASVVVNNETGATASNRILTGSGANLTLSNNASLVIIYNTTSSRWMIVGSTSSTPSSSTVTASITAGENLTTNDAVYVSIGAGDGGRTAGSVYKLDATNSNRMEFIGLVTQTVLSGAAATVQLVGELSGFTGLTTGQPIYASVTTSGATQNTAPTTAGQWVIQLGLAISATKLAINGSGSATAIQIASSSGSYLNRSSVSANTTLTNSNDVVLVNAAGGAINITLPTPSDGKLFYIKKTDSSVNAVNVLPSSSETIDGESRNVLQGQYDSVELISDGTNWWVL